MKDITRKDAYSLRERKHARTKVALMQAFITRMRATRFADISVRDVCRDVEVSEGTFFNYFPRKIDVIYYYSQMVSLYVIWRARAAKAARPPAAIEAAFAAAAGMMDSPYLIYEMISVLVGEKKVLQPMSISPLEKRYAFSSCDGIEKVDADPVLRMFFSSLIQHAVNAGDLPKKTNKEDAGVALVTILVGVPLALTPERFSQVGPAYQRQLTLLWKALKRQ